MERRTTTVTAVLLSVSALAAAACSDSADQSPNASAGGDAGAYDPSDGRDGGAVPTFDFGATTSQPSSADDGGVPSFDFDAAVTPPPPLTPQQRGIWSVDAEHHLLRIIADDPSQVAVVAQLDLPATEHVIGLDFRPSNGMLYAMTMPASRLYTIDKVTAKVTPVGGETSPRVLGQAYGFDFNPAADLLRVQSDVDQNLRINPSTGAVVGQDGMLAFGPTDVNAGQSPNLVGSAYTNNVAGAASTVLYAIDSTRNLLTKVDPPNAGSVTTIGPLGIDVVAHVGFDIRGEGGDLEAYAALRVAGSSATGLYMVDLTTGAATLSGEIMHPIPLSGIAVEP